MSRIYALIRCTWIQPKKLFDQANTPNEDLT